MEPIIFAGTPVNAAETLRALVQAGQPIALVITRNDAPVGRKRVITPSPVAQVAVELGLPVLKTNRISEIDEAVIAMSGARLAIVVAFGALLKPSTISILELGWFNLHYSVLPRWRGASPVQSALLAGDKTTGVTLFKIDEGLDTGDVVGVVETMIEPGENTERLLSRLSSLGVSLVLQELPGLMSGFVKLKPQQGEPTFAPKYERKDSRIVANDGAKTALAKVLAFNPEPIAWFEYQGNQIRVLEASASSASIPVGELVQTEKRVLLGVANAESIELLNVQPAGKNPMPAIDWFRGTKPEERKIS